MANKTYFFLRPGKKSESPVYVRCRFNGKDFVKKVPELKVNPNLWPEGENAQLQARTNFPILGTIGTVLDESMEKNTFTEEHMERTLSNAAYKDERDKAAEELRKAAEDKKKVSFMSYFANFVEGLDKGTRKAESGHDASERTVTNYRQGYNRLCEYQKAKKVKISWETIDRDFLNKYVIYLQSEARGEDRYNQNTCAKRVKEIKRLFREARKEGVTACEVPDYTLSETVVDSGVYLTMDELRAIMAVDITDLPIGYEWARDLFLVGCWVGQRVSDYAHITKDQITTDEDGIMYITILQQKTKAKVTIPVRSELRAILEKYDYKLPRFGDEGQYSPVLINRYLKVIGYRAGLVEMVEYTSTKGGKEHKERKPKYELLSSHCARRTFATLAYLEGMDSVDIRQITGHSSDKMLMKYIRSTPQDNARSMAKKYDFFK